MKRLFLVVLLALLVLAGVLAVRTLRLAPPAPLTEMAGPPQVSFDTAGAATRLAGAVRFPTVSMSSGGPIDTTAFLGLHDYLSSAFPLVAQSLSREMIGGLSLVYTWPGIDPSLAPVVLMGHMDVVPVPEPTLGQWVHPPFAGAIADGFVWGRGTLDDKTTVLSILEAVEALLRNGYRPPRTVYLMFGHDEEVGGRFGAGVAVDTLVGRGVTPALVLDEGGFMAAKLMPGIERRIAIVGVAEKGYLSLRLRATAAGGHSSMPPTRTAIGALGRAITRLETSPFPRSLEGPTRHMLEAMAPYMSFGQRVMLSNLWLTAPLVSQTLAANPLSAALQRTTTAPTMLQAGIKDNVLPPEATAVVNFRIRPGETSASVTARVAEIVADSQITIEPVDPGVDPSPVSDVKSAAYGLVSETIRRMIPGEDTPVIPYLVMGGTDAKYWAKYSDKTFRFLPIPLGDGDRERIHGVNERVSLGDYAMSVGFFGRLLQSLDRL
ncbi:MAG: M20 family peptidase [Gemmatimonadales bacterium]